MITKKRCQKLNSYVAHLLNILHLDHPCVQLFIGENSTLKNPIGHLKLLKSLNLFNFKLAILVIIWPIFLSR